MTPEIDYNKFASKDEIYFEKTIMPATTIKNEAGMTIPVMEIVKPKLINNSKFFAGSGVSYPVKENILTEYWGVFSSIETDYNSYILKHINSFKTEIEASDFTVDRFRNISNRQSSLENLVRSKDISKIKFELLEKYQVSMNEILGMFRCGEIDESNMEAFSEWEIPEKMLINKEDVSLTLVSIFVKVK